MVHGTKVTKVPSSQGCGRTATPEGRAWGGGRAGNDAGGPRSVLISVPCNRTPTSPAIASTGPSASAPRPFLPMSARRDGHPRLDSCDVIIVTGDAYDRSPELRHGLIGRVLEAQGFRSASSRAARLAQRGRVRALGPPNLFFGITAGNMDRWSTAHRRSPRAQRRRVYPRRFSG